jgi:predicted Rossmann fold nucleotide-binding protein DprA/Smf involved in DNA uptake
LKEKLKKSAPPVIYGVGNSEMLDGGGLAMVGSRNVDKEGLEFTRKIAAKCVQEKIQIVSGGARGVDEASMQASLEEGGTAIGVLSNKLEQAAVAGKYRKWIMEGSLVLVSPYSPKAPFTVGNAMGRNKHIYTLSDWALVISSSVDKGGTWTGANENLKNSWVPLFVRSGPNVPDGNIRLIQLGGKPMSDKAMGEDISILACLQGQGGDTISEKEAPIPKEIAGIKTVDHQKIEETQGELPGSEPKNANGKVNDLFEIVWPHIERELKTAKLPKDLAESFNINQNQMKDWLERALETGSVKKLTRPVRYVAISQKEFWT